MKVFLLLFSLAAVAVGMMLYSADRNQYQTPADQAAELEARAQRTAFGAAKLLVTQQLKAPATAKFPTLLDDQCGCRSVESNRWEAWGYVDSQNTFGALLRANWSATIERLPSGNFVLITSKIGSE